MRHIHKYWVILLPILGKNMRLSSMKIQYKIASLYQIRYNFAFQPLSSLKDFFIERIQTLFGRDNKRMLTSTKKYSTRINRANEFSAMNYLGDAIILILLSLRVILLSRQNTKYFLVQLLTIWLV